MKGCRCQIVDLDRLLKKTGCEAIERYEQYRIWESPFKIADSFNIYAELILPKNLM